MASSSYARTFGTDMIIQQKNHGGSQDIFIRPIDGLTASEPINLTTAGIWIPAIRWTPDGRFIYFTAASAARAICSRGARGGREVEQVTKASGV
jgi:hypothetical protein